jgi:hypothetical protein
MHVFAAGDKPGWAVQCPWRTAPRHQAKPSAANPGPLRSAAIRINGEPLRARSPTCQNRVNFGYTQVVHVECHCTRT